MRKGSGGHRGGRTVLVAVGALTVQAAVAFGAARLLVAERRRKRSSAREAAEWLESLSAELELKLREAAERVREKVCAVRRLPHKERDMVDAAVERTRARLSDVCADFLFRLGEVPDGPSAGR